MKIYEIPCSWEMYGIMKIEADSLEDALELSQDEYLPDAEYIIDSFNIDYEALDDYNKEEE